MRAPRPARTTVVSFCVLLGTLALTSTPAQAARSHVLSASLGSPGEGAGELSLVSTNRGGVEGEAPGSGVGVNDATGDVYVADTGNRRVDEFGADGAFVRAWGWGVVDGNAELETCVSSCKAGLSGSGAGQFETPIFVAVDNDPGSASFGDVYVADVGTKLVQKFTAAGALVTGWGDGTPADGQLAGRNVPEGPFGEVGTGQSWSPFSGIAVDDAGDLWVLTAVKGENFWLYQFEQGGALVDNCESSSEGMGVGGFAYGLGVDSAGDLYAGGGVAQIRKMSSGCEVLGHLTPQSFQEGFTVPTGLAVDQAPGHGELYIDADGSLIERIASSCKPNLGYASQPFCVPVESFGSGVLSGGAGLAVDSSDEAVYAADAGGDVVDVFGLHPASAPVVEGESVAGVSSESARLIAEVNPESEPGERGTVCSFEYISEAAYGENIAHGVSPFTGAMVVPVSGGVLAANFEVDRVSAHPQGLRPGTVYRYRVVAGNGRGVSEGERGEKGEEVAQSFATQSVGGELVLADGREWEMVTPPDKRGALFTGLNKGLETNGDGASVVQASADGGAIAVMATSPIEVEPRGFDNLVSVLSTRGSGGWSSRVLTPPHDEAAFVSLGNGGEFRLFSEDLSEAVVQPFGGFTPLSPASSEPTAYLRANFAGGSAAVGFVVNRVIGRWWLVVRVRVSRVRRVSRKTRMCRPARCSVKRPTGGYAHM